MDGRFYNDDNDVRKKVIKEKENLLFVKMEMLLHDPDALKQL